jgi:hypothetical protein
MRFVVLALVGLATVSCARDVKARYPAADGDATGTVVLVFTRPSPDVYVAINGVLVVDGAHTSRIRVDGVTTGYADVAIAVGPGEKTVRVWVEEGRDTVLPIGSPGGSHLDSVKSIVVSLAAIAIYAWIR